LKQTGASDDAFVARTLRVCGFTMPMLPEFTTARLSACFSILLAWG
jgi:hypothetical protein